MVEMPQTQLTSWLTPNELFHASSASWKVWSRRAFLWRLTLAGTTGLLYRQPRPVAAEPPPETATIRLGQKPAICIAPLYVAAELLTGEGFTEVHYVKLPEALFAKAMAAGEMDLALNFAGPLLRSIEAGDPLVVLAGGHVGCFELFAGDQVRTIHDLKGKTVAVTELGGPDHVFLASIAAYIGLDPGKDVHWVTHPFVESTRLLAEGKIDAALAFPPQSQELRATQIGHVVVNSSADRPWSQYFCCLVYANHAFVRQHPVATKRALRAILKAADVCALEPERAAQVLVDKRFTPRYDYGLRTMQEVPYTKWRASDPEDTVRFYALRLQEAGMIKSTPEDHHPGHGLASLQ
jgi:NitT/TauT family transport system substrate-binding protein